ncbi:hypothetical protein HZS61_005362 [Fusarium oxysporum f. sp. conglutinans]|uniref:PD-(D/E)XK nuclease-like domain-containing protein n=2 Tax=Fusarium oxysporum f. sp. conglutinans TaxID=100902 RepID=A0A8H6GD36_FUSOX|nr:hypothetical protein HZS61_005362 [Fusarium oxysporum f. sp. conglutinans]KAG6980417.1 hypothetical protein FocnCong_v009822 [Fusarium oxysporum f. sp. conglutinans]KAI8401816.1 hypothetical protein FOFC_18685 [Fusarium oxysporum]
MASDLENKIERWLEELHSSGAEPQRPAKRQKVHHRNSQLPSPQNSESSDSDLFMAPKTPTVKRKDTHDEVYDDDVTPRATKGRTSIATLQLQSKKSRKSASASQSETTTESGASAGSRRSMTVNQFPISGIGNHAMLLEVMSSTATGMPDELKTMFRDLQRIGLNKNFLPKQWEATIKARALTDPDFEDLGDFSYMSPEVEPEHSLPQPEMLPALLYMVDRIVVESARCSKYFDEPGWNNLVHSPILNAVFNQRFWPGDEHEMVEYSPVITAPVTAVHHMFPHSSAKVDYVVHIQPPPETQDAVETLYESTSEKSVNHTAFPPLRRSPISLTIETKRYGGNHAKANAQVCSWQAAQWTCLASQAGEGIKHLPFLPGIVVNGPSWTFVATTRNGDKTTIWTDAAMGSTTSSLGVLKIMGALNKLRQWTIKVYWPWYKKHVLKIGQVDTRPAQVEGDAEMDSGTAGL